jgi:threonine synthase
VQLSCRACGHVTEPLGVQYCDRCFGPLDLVDELPAGAPRTPLRRAPDLGPDVWLKDESVNPTGSFKDRVVAAAAARADELGAPVLACSSTGNLARALAAHAGRRAVVVVPRTLPGDERDALVAQGATVVVVDGDYDAANRVAAEASEELGHWGWVNGNLRPWYAAGARTVGLELVAHAPEQVVVPMASGALAYQVHRALPAARLVVVQPSGCAPVAEAFARGDDDVRPVRSTTTVEVLAMGDPPDGTDVLAAARRTGGAVLAVDEDDLDDAWGDLASSVAVAGARQVFTDGVLDPDARTVVVLTGGNPRWPEPVGPSGRAVTIAPTLAALQDALPEEQT